MTSDRTPLTRIEIESRLNRDRAWLLETYARLAEADLVRAVTASEADSSIVWSPLDHLVHLAGIEQAFNAMIRRHLSGNANPVGLIAGPDGKPRSRDEIMAGVHRGNEDWVEQYRGRALADVVALSQRMRSETLALLAELTDAQLGQKLPGAPWADGTIGGVIATNAYHGRQHWAWIVEQAPELAPT